MIKLLLPVLFPSWRFFSSIGASPRIQFSFLQAVDSEPQQWQEFRPQPLQLTFAENLLRLFWSPKWNEKLYINTCAERLFEEYSVARENEIASRIVAAINCGEINNQAADNYIQFRICAVIREGKHITQPLVFISKPASLKGAVS